MLTFVVATFTSPEMIGTDVNSFLWSLPLVAAIAVVWKALKVKEISPGNFIKETAVLAGTLLVFLIIVAIGLYAVTWIVTE